MKNLILVLSLTLCVFTVKGQDDNNLISNSQKPKLIVGVVVDQMRYDYLTRFWDKYQEGGFKRLVRNGYNFRNNHFNYIPTYTGPGHASVYAGTSPQNHGIIGNDWYNKFEEREVYCTGDDNVTPVGTTSSAGKMSPHRMTVTTVADENRLFTQMRGKTIGIALKDRGAILPAGHTANGAYWFHGGNEGKWITSSFYMEKLPEWVTSFNKSGKVDSYMRTWNTLKDIETYTESGPDQTTFEGGYNGRSTFPYDLKELASEERPYELLKVTPYGNSITTDFAIAALDGEELGQDDFTDFLTISYSSTDYVGHNFGVNSKEVQDSYLRLDQDLASLLRALDEKVGKGNYTLFLTSDHGGVDVPSYLSSVKIPAGYFDNKSFEEKLRQFVSDTYEGAEIIKYVYNYQVFFDYDVLREKELSANDVEVTLAHYLLQYPQINNVFTRTQLQSGSFSTGTAALVQNGFNQKRSGDVIFVLKPSVISYSETGSTHGSGFSYDTHAPLIFFGNGIRRGSSSERTEIIDIAPTISALLGISFPNGNTGKPLFEMLDQRGNN
ncbi:MAG TPA: alkaline phosphatase PafA [Gillisia sp.]|nr:alkaline phosphatase PafA [Gillisia sp.]